jgi:ApaG protein
LAVNRVETGIGTLQSAPDDVGSADGIRYDGSMMAPQDLEPARMYRAVTRQIEVTVEPNFMPERSSPERQQYFWSYTIVITNASEETVQLKRRHWIITDGTGRKQEVRGEGVVGEQPVLAPGERFEYTSGVPLPTASGIMTGRYQMVSETGERFEIDVPTFSLDSPEGKRTLN